MSIQPRVPGLIHNLFEENADDDSCEDLTLKSFEGTSFCIPVKGKFNRCRSINDFKKCGAIGKGSFAIIYKGIDTKTDEVVALKKIRLMKSEPIPLTLIREISVLKQLNHINVLKLLNIALGKSAESIYLIMEYCPYCLVSIIDSYEKITVELSQIKSIIRQLFGGLSHIHKFGIIHRDITPTNIIFDHCGILKIADFGSSRRESEDMTPNVVTRWYKAPEILLGAKTYTSAIDMWSAGCVLAELILRKPLFKGDTDIDMIDQIVDVLGTPSEALWPGFSDLLVMRIYTLKNQPCNNLKSHFVGQPPSCIALLLKLFTYNPKTRIRADDSLYHTFFSEYPSAGPPKTLVPLLESLTDHVDM